MKNLYSTNSALRRAVRSLTQFKEEKANTLPGKLRDVATAGHPCEFQFNHLRIRYLTKDETGVFRLYWLVTNAISGRQRYLYNIDYVSPRGRILWRKMASDMKKV